MKILYVVGYGRSGSTVFERALGTALGAVRVGEVRHIWTRGFKDNQLCECGEPFYECAFWSEVRLHMSERVNLTKIDQILRMKKEVDRIRFIPFLLNIDRAPSWYRKRWSEYAQYIRALYEAISEVSGGKIVVDSTKDPSYGYLVMSLFGPSVRFIHLVRRMPAVVYSWRNPKVRPEIHWGHALMPRYSWSRAAAEWVVMNALAAQLVRQVPTGSFALTYEAFVERPQDMIAEAARTAGVEESLSFDHWYDERTIDYVPGHTLSGNPVRFAKSRLVIRPDTRWYEVRARFPYRLLCQVDSWLLRWWLC